MAKSKQWLDLTEWKAYVESTKKPVEIKCRKKKFDSALRAEQALVYAIRGRQEYGKEHRREEKSYYCKICKAYHLTSKKEKDF